MTNMSQAQADQQNNRDGAGQYATKKVGESGVAIPTDPPTTEHVDFDTTFEEFGEFSTISDGPTERGMVGYWSQTLDDGTLVEVTSQLAVSQDEETGLWWQIYRDTQNVTTPDGQGMSRELGCGNVESRTFDTQDDAWASLQGAKGSLTFEEQHSNGHFEVADRDWYEEYS